MESNIGLYQKLIELRTSLRKKYYDRKKNKTPNICSDQVLWELIKWLPKRKEDLICVPGIGQTFVDKYGDDFMKIFTDYHNQSQTKVKINKNVARTLKDLENRLVNVNRKNRLLYCGKLYSKYGVDLYSENKTKNDELIRFILSNSKRVLKICIFSKAEDNHLYRKLVTLWREVNRDFTETGQYDLYIAYPFLTGKIRKENFSIRAPLALFPVELVKEADTFGIKMNDNKDVLVNTTLILTFMKFNGIEKELPNPIIEEIGKDFIKDIINFYQENGILIKNTDSKGLEKFIDYTSNDFPNHENGDFYLANHVVLGRYSMFSSVLQKDFNQIIDQNVVSDLIHQLLLGVEDIDYYSDEITTDSSTINLEISEKELNYINDLNLSQEQSIMRINTDKKLVIQGPPGTGKSQTITSIICDYVHKGHNVLMVSQKKAALDVIYSRLGVLAKYAIFIPDVKDKELFYKELEQKFNDETPSKYQARELDQLAKNIDDEIEQLNEIEKKLFHQHQDYQVSICTVYQENKENQFLVKGLMNYRYYREVLENSHILTFSYPQICQYEKIYEDPKVLEEMITFLNTIEKYPWLENMEDQLSDIDLYDLQSIINEFTLKKSEYMKLNFIKKLFKKGKLKKELKKKIAQFFKSISKTMISGFFKYPNWAIDGVNKYEQFTSLKSIYQSHSEAENQYLNWIYKIGKILHIPDIEINKGIKDYYVYTIISKFESENRNVLTKLNHFDQIVNKVSQLIASKKEVTKGVLYEVMKNHFQTYVASSKRASEMKRIIESKRKWSITKYIRKFGFEMFKGIRVWLLTPEVVSEILPLDQNLFDLLIFDEASQLYIEKAIPSLARTSKVIVAGDHKQLRPSSLGFGRIEYDENYDYESEEIETNAALEEESLLDLARFKYPQILLNCHYRSKYVELIAFSNYAFYKGKLNVSPNVKNPKRPPIEVIRVDNGVWIDRQNHAEANEVIRLLKNFFKERKKLETIGVITFNSSQRDLIMDFIDAECRKDPIFAQNIQKEFARKENGEDIGLFIKNIENVQGDERDYIIFSIAYAKNESGKVVRNYGWLNQRGGENRLNVAITRAKEKIYLVTSILPEELIVDDLKYDGPKIFKKYLEYSYAISNQDKDKAQAILLSFGEVNNKEELEQKESGFEQQVYDKLIEAGFMVHTNIGIGGYLIDMAIVNPKTNNYILGIDCDRILYNQTSATRERDIHRQKYLTSQGWKIYRIWSYYWFHDANKEIEKIKQLI